MKILIDLYDLNSSIKICKSLTDAGYEAEYVNDGNQVIETLNKVLPDLLIIDLKLQGKSGYDVLFEKSLDKNITKIPTLILSVSGDTVYMKRIPKNKSIVDIMVTLHINIDQILDKVRYILPNPNMLI